MTDNTVHPRVNTLLLRTATDFGYGCGYKRDPIQIRIKYFQPVGLSTVGASFFIIAAVVSPCRCGCEPLRAGSWGGEGMLGVRVSSSSSSQSSH